VTVPSGIGILDTDDCPVCRSAGSVYGQVCDVCLADLAEHEGPPHEAIEDPPVRLIDLLGEMEALSLLAARLGHTGELAVAGRRIRDLLLELRRQFVEDAILGSRDRPGPVP
jgi:predicted amidophosphoribosyltransferase